MTALSAERDTKQFSPAVDPAQLSLPVAAATKLWKGGIVCDNNSGYATKGATALNLKAVGRAEETVDNTAGSAGDKSVEVRRGAFYFANSAGGDEITIAERFSECYIVDDQTVAKTDGGGTRSRAGIILDVHATYGVLVLIGAATDAQVSALQTSEFRAITRTFDYADSDVALSAMSAAIAVGSALPAGAWVLAVVADNTEDWTDGSSGTFSMDVGDGTDPDKFTPTALDIDNGIALLNVNNAAIEGGGDQLTVTITSNVNLDTATAGTTKLTVLYVVPNTTTVAAP